MLTRNERQQLEAQWSSDDRSIANYGRLLKSAVLGVMVLGLVWIAGTADRDTGGREQAATVSTPAVTRVQSDGSALRASQQSFEARRAHWEGQSPRLAQQAASR